MGISDDIKLAMGLFASIIFLVIAAWCVGYLGDMAFNLFADAVAQRISENAPL